MAFILLDGRLVKRLRALRGDSKAAGMFSFPAEMKTAEAGSRALSRFGATSEQIYLVTRDLTPSPQRTKGTAYTHLK